MYENNIAIILGKLYNEEIIDILDIAEALIKLRKPYNDICGKMDNNSSDKKVRKRINKRS